eukprot:CAMPEP_0180162932 /NCGR_PEP_ID=MMETSP0986-20121125/29507_1 /TAXON_ID=697907 /ORGANISM="non described non described, Strain CCMP2293" /LENGTH=52 /DNA_ID=CAMNT_0022113489 /DNA_START=557 /DNA_END=712 /DNA_ORIENTATION=-
MTCSMGRSSPVLMLRDVRVKRTASSAATSHDPCPRNLVVKNCLWHHAHDAST